MDPGGLRCAPMTSAELLTNIKFVELWIFNFSKRWGSGNPEDPFKLVSEILEYGTNIDQKTRIGHLVIRDQHLLTKNVMAVQYVRLKEPKQSKVIFSCN